MDIKYDVFDWAVTIYDSYKVTSRKEMNAFLNKIREENPSNPFLARKSNSRLIVEWEAHNLLYELGYQTDKTKDVDLSDETSKTVTEYYLLAFAYRIKKMF